MTSSAISCHQLLWEQGITLSCDRKPQQGTRCALNDWKCHHPIRKHIMNVFITEIGRDSGWFRPQTHLDQVTGHYDCQGTKEERRKKLRNIKQKPKQNTKQGTVLGKRSSTVSSPLPGSVFYSLLACRETVPESQRRNKRLSRRSSACFMCLMGGPCTVIHKKRNKEVSKHANITGKNYYSFEFPTAKKKPLLEIISITRETTHFDVHPSSYILCPLLTPH